MGKESKNPLENNNQSKVVTLEQAQAFLKWRSNQDRTNYQLPSADQLKYALSRSLITAIGREWTSEGWIYDPKQDKLNKNPGRIATAFFRAVIN